MSKKIIITGARGLIGSVVSKKFKEKGYDVAELDLVLGHDLTDEAFVKKWFSEHPADSLVNLFAINDHIESERQSNKLMDIDLDSFRKYLEVNLIGLFSVCREFSRSNDRGAIVNFSSTYGIVSPSPKLYGDNEKNIAYGVSKAGVIQLTRHLAVHLAPHFRVNCIVPGGVKHKQSEEFQHKYGLLTPLGRMMNASELFDIIDYLISDKSSYCTGGIYVVDGGWTVW